MHPVFKIVAALKSRSRLLLQQARRRRQWRGHPLLELHTLHQIALVVFAILLFVLLAVLTDYVPVFQPFQGVSLHQIFANSLTLDHNRVADQQQHLRVLFALHLTPQRTRTTCNPSSLTKIYL